MTMTCKFKLHVGNFQLIFHMHIDVCELPWMCKIVSTQKHNAQIFPLHEKVYKFVSNSNVVESNKTINIV
jgi:hypothetical protein